MKGAGEVLRRNNSLPRSSFQIALCRPPTLSHRGVTYFRHAMEFSPAKCHGFSVLTHILHLICTSTWFFREAPRDTYMKKPEYFHIATTVPHADTSDLFETYRQQGPRLLIWIQKSAAFAIILPPLFQLWRLVSNHSRLLNPSAILPNHLQPMKKKALYEVLEWIQHLEAFGVFEAARPASSISHATISEWSPPTTKQKSLVRNSAAHIDFFQISGLLAAQKTPPKLPISPPRFWKEIAILESRSHVDDHISAPLLHI